MGVLIDLDRDKSVSRLVRRLGRGRSGDGPVRADGTWGSFAPLLAVHLSRRLGRPILFISPHIDDADDVADDVRTFGAEYVEVFGVWEAQGPGHPDATDAIGAQRLRIAAAMARQASSPPSGLIISTSIQALIQPVPDPGALEQGQLTIAAGQTCEPDRLVEQLYTWGFESVDRVDMPGQFARRGGIVDVFAPTCQASAMRWGRVDRPEPYRIEFFGDAVESIRAIDLDSQRSTDTVEQIIILPPSLGVDPTAMPNDDRPGTKTNEGTGIEADGVTDSPVVGADAVETRSLLDLLWPETVIVLHEPAQIAEVAELFLQRVDDPRGLYRFGPLYEAMQRFSCLEISRFAVTGPDESIHLRVTSAQRYQHKPGAGWKHDDPLPADLLAGDRRVLLYCENAAEQQRVRQIVQDIHGRVPPTLELPIGFIHQGFVLESLGIVVLAHHEVFGQYALRRHVRSVRAGAAIRGVLDLKKGDYVVHVSYGIGKFVGIEVMDKDGSTTEYLTLEYADKVRIHVPVSNIGLVQKYIGAMPRRPRLSRIGTKAWQRQTERVRRGVQDLAAELLETQARRRQLGGFAFEAETPWQREFEAAFPYPETPDQATTSAEIRADMARPVAMDRLVCGDVGYGKTELAMRAAFRAVQAGKQVAVLVPTTVLSVQHGRTFAQRFGDYPVIVEVLNRFVPDHRARDILQRCREGTVDILIGTHRLLSDDVAFKDLGLVVIDEEQRFGVEHKERLKRFRVNVDVLTLTATPIPRTLHMAMLGLRDISSLATPPLDRRSIVTRLCRRDPALIRQAIRHELARDGQVFFLHNRVRSIARVADEIRTLLDDPRVRIGIAHGQMPKHELEETMLRFVECDIDVLVCSTIIESGLDIPNANTLIVDEADRFGLAQLHQLRGRVGRYKHRAYAYFLLPSTRPVTPIAVRRLKAIEEYSELGAGFRIALQDLEIRGAGNILGPEQSGHINTVGYEMYCRLLAEAVRRLTHQPIEQAPETVIDVGLAAYVPRSYIASDRQRLDVYHRIAEARTPDDVRRLGEEIADLFGPIPPAVQRVLDLAEIRLLAWAHGIRRIIRRDRDLIFTVTEDTRTADLFARAPGRVTILDPKTVYVRPEPRDLEADRLVEMLRRLLGTRARRPTTAGGARRKRHG